LHAGAGLALALELRTPPAGGDGLPDRRRAGLLALSCAPPALAAALWRGTIERRLGGPRSIAVALAAGAVLMALADTLPAGGGQRRSEQAGAGDGLALGLAQALALIPGVSRSGATLTAARSRGFRRADAHSLSWEVALPVILGASLVEACRLVGAGARGAPARTLLAAGGTSFLATALSARALRRGRYRDRPLLPYSIYRCALAAAVAVRRRRAAGV
ncbi:MAG TPA: undecaprenyl-diphosphate phosphatase, partial [Solirubrobacteraceae bacterium]|nr:undecaprenyl-diphosphate phosphatase [Solirubrobacteraceae bacterium]